MIITHLADTVLEYRKIGFLPGSEQIQHLLYLLLTFNRKIKMCIGGAHFSHTVAHIKRYAVEQLGAAVGIAHHGEGAALCGRSAGLAFWQAAQPMCACTGQLRVSIKGR